MLRIKKMTEAVGKHVYTSDGDHFGQIDDVNLVDNKIDGWKIKISGGFMNVLGGARCFRIWDGNPLWILNNYLKRVGKEIYSI